MPGIVYAHHVINIIRLNAPRCSSCRVLCHTWLCHQLAFFLFPLYYSCMSRLNQAPPLKNVSPGVIGPGTQYRVADTQCELNRWHASRYKVAQHRNEPFLRRQRSRKTRAAVQLLSTFAQLELVLKKTSSDKVWSLRKKGWKGGTLG